MNSNITTIPLTNIEVNNPTIEEFLEICNIEKANGKMKDSKKRFIDSETLRSTLDFAKNDQMLHFHFSSIFPEIEEYLSIGNPFLCFSEGAELQKNKYRRN